MSVNRIASNFLTQQAVNYLQGNQRILSNLQERLSSNRAINRPSDDPVGMTRVIDLGNTIAQDNRYARNVSDALAELNTADSALSGMSNLIQRARELAVQAASDTINPSGRQAIAGEIDQIITQMVVLGNTRIGEKAIFSGFRTDVTPFARDANGVTYVGNPPDEDWEREVAIAPDRTVAININGEILLGTVSTATVTGSGVFQTLEALRQDLQGNNTSGIRSRIDQLQSNLDGILTEQGRLGGVANQLELTQTRLDERKGAFTGQIASLQDIDLAKTITDLTFQQGVVQASLAVTARVQQTSLLNYL